MVLVFEHIRNPLGASALRTMFEARKLVFVDLLKWDVPVVAGRFELDQFDDEHAVYLVALGGEGEHLASARLLRTTRPHLLDSLFADLCAVPPPRGPNVLEITRFCVDRRLPARRRLEARNLLVSAIADFALLRGVTTYTGVAEIGWLQQILAFGWSCHPLGLPVLRDGKMLGALRIDIDAGTPALLASNAIYSAAALAHCDALQAA